jgi:YfiR/HmsC-like
MQRAPAARLSRRRFVLAAAPLLALPTFAQSPADARVKSKLVLNMARFAQWPATAFATAADPLLVCVMQRNDLLAEAFAELGGQTAAGHPIRVLADPGKDLKACHVLFVHESAERIADAALAALESAPVLTIGDGEGFAGRGGMVALVNVNDTIRFDVNLKALRAAQLGMSSQVLKLARRVRE